MVPINTCYSAPCGDAENAAQCLVGTLFYKKQASQFGMVKKKSTTFYEY